LRCNLILLGKRIDMSVRPKKFLGQHFLTNRQIAAKIVDALEVTGPDAPVVEIGPGTGVLTSLLLDKPVNLKAVELDRDAVAYLIENYPKLTGRIIESDFLKLDIDTLFDKPYSIIGNLPYNISSQIFFKILENRKKVLQVVCMIQKEVAQRITTGPGSKTYGKLSVLLQAYFDMEYLFTVKPEAFRPPPKVDSAVIRMKRNHKTHLDCDEKLFFRIVKQGFQNRRKTLRNALKPINLPDVVNEDPLLDKRAETLDVDDFVYLAGKIQQAWNK